MGIYANELQEVRIDNDCPIPTGHINIMNIYATMVALLAYYSGSSWSKEDSDDGLPSSNKSVFLEPADGLGKYEIVSDSQARAYNIFCMSPVKSLVIDPEKIAWGTNIFFVAAPDFDGVKSSIDGSEIEDEEYLGANRGLTLSKDEATLCLLHVTKVTNSVNGSTTYSPGFYLRNLPSGKLYDHSATREKYLKEHSDD